MKSFFLFCFLHHRGDVSSHKCDLVIRGKMLNRRCLLNYWQKMPAREPETALRSAAGYLEIRDILRYYQYAQNKELLLHFTVWKGAKVYQREKTFWESRNWQMLLGVPVERTGKQSGKIKIGLRGKKTSPSSTVPSEKWKSVASIDCSSWWCPTPSYVSAI